ncbi:MAG: hypothetical protein E6R13_00885 [Spirochaetes bacterium]|nr:MAG: hypothetical protein E6R13_00885 [Spirochaetota bacterium]
MKTDIETLDDMAAVVSDWYNNMTARFNHYATIPSGMSVTIDGVDMTMEGPLHTGFVAAMQTAVNELKVNPPFVVTTDD